MTYGLRIIIQSCIWGAILLGVLLNGLFIYTIVRHTPKIMKIYRKILLQTSITDLLLLFMTLFFQQYAFTTKMGEQETICNGLITFKGGENRILALLAYCFWVLLVCTSFNGYLSQFIYRYLMLNWAKNISTFKYFLLFIITLILPLIYTVNLFLTYINADNKFLEDEQIADFLGLNLNDKILVVGYSKNDLSITIGFYYIAILCTIVYAIIFALAFLMHNFLKNHTKTGVSTVLTDKMDEMNKQISRTLVIQASLPIMVYFSIILYVVQFLFNIDLSALEWFKYYNLIVKTPMVLPCAINPIVSIYTIRYYRYGILADIRKIAHNARQFLSK